MEMPEPQWHSGGEASAFRSERNTTDYIRKVAEGVTVQSHTLDSNTHHGAGSCALSDRRRVQKVCRQCSQVGMVVGLGFRVV
eukprot:2159351-Rhodomonas_salina.1